MLLKDQLNNNMAFHTKIESTDGGYIGYIMEEETLVYTSEVMKQSSMLEAILKSEVIKLSQNHPKYRPTVPLTPNALRTSNIYERKRGDNEVPAPRADAGTYVPKNEISKSQNAKPQTPPRRCCGRG